MRRKRRIVVWLSSISLILVIVGVAAVRLLGLPGAASELETQLRMAREDGLSAEPSDLLRPPVTAQENAASALLDAYKKAWALPGSPIKILTTFGRPPPSDKERRQALQELGPVLGTVQVAASRPHMDFNWDWNKGYDLQIPEMEVIRKIEDLHRCFIAQAHFESVDGHRDPSIQCLMAAANLDRLLAEVKSIFAYDARLAMEATVLGETENLLRLYPTDRKLLSDARTILTTLGPLPDIRSAQGTELVMERIFMHKLPYWSKFHPSIKVDDGFRPAEYLLRLNSLSDRNDANLVAETRKTFEALPRDDADLPRAMRKFKDIPDSDQIVKALEGPEIVTFRLEHLLPEFNFGADSLDVWARCVARRRVFMAGVDILEQKIHTGAFAASWSKIGKDGIDPFTDRPLAYRKTKSGFVVYSFDRDRKNDGGRPYALTSDPERKHDISFEYPKKSVAPETKR